MKRFILPVILILYITIFVNNVTGLESENVLGGVRAEENQFSYEVSLQIRGSHICGAALIAPNVILTAAHCFVSNTSEIIVNKPWIVVAATVNSKDRKLKTPLTKIYLPKSRIINNTLIRPDIAVAKLLNSFDNDRYPIRILSLPERGESFVYKTVTHVGFGWNKVIVYKDVASNRLKEIGSKDGNLRYLRMNVSDSANCPFSLYTFCARTASKDSLIPEGPCAGDSGSSLVYDDKIIGVLSTSTYGCDTRTNGYAKFTQVSEFIDLINSAIEDKPTNDMTVKSLHRFEFHAK